MKKLFKFIPVICLLFVFTILFSACSLGTYTVAFIDYDGKFVGIKTYSNGEEINNTPSVSYRPGYNFSGWEKDITPPASIDPIPSKTDIVMYASYKINPQDPYFFQSGCKIEWYGGNLSPTVYINAGETKMILLQDKISYSNITKIEILAGAGSNFSCETLKVYDNNGYLTGNNVVFHNIWQPSSTSSLGEFNFILEITAYSAGEAIIQIS